MFGNMGALLKDMGQLEQAEPLFEEALKASRGRYMWPGRERRVARVRRVGCAVRRCGVRLRGGGLRGSPQCTESRV